MKKLIKRIKGFLKQPFRKRKKELVLDLPARDLTQYNTKGEPIVKVLDSNTNITTLKEKHSNDYKKELLKIANHRGTARASPEVLRRLADGP